MKKDLLEFLFGASQQDSAVDDLVNVDFAKLLEDADEDEAKSMAADKAPLNTALKSIGIDGSGLLEDPEGFVLVTHDRDEYVAACNLLSDPESMHTLATKGWVAFKCGDQAMSNEEAEYKLRFMDITTAEGDDSDSGESESTILKNARKFATEEPEHDNDENPVDHAAPDGNSLKKVKIGKPTDGKQPEGKIKDSLDAAALVSRLLEAETFMPKKEACGQYEPSQEPEKPTTVCYHCGHTRSKHGVKEDCGQPGSPLKKPAMGGKVKHAFKTKKK